MSTYVPNRYLLNDK